MDAERPRLFFDDHNVSSWAELVDAVDALTSGGVFVFRGHNLGDRPLATTLERNAEPGRRVDVERDALWHFVRTAPRLLPAHLVPPDSDAAAWLGLIQHYGGPTRLLDFTKSPYVALFFAYESAGNHERAVWAIDHAWCMAECSRIMAEAEGIPLDMAFGRAAGAQAQLVYSLVYGQPYRDQLFKSFKPFTGVFPLDPWKPDTRQLSQQAMFLVAANVETDFVGNLSAHLPQQKTVIYRLGLPASLRSEVLRKLSIMNVTAATLFPDLGGLARSLLTLTRPPAQTRLR